MRPASRELAKLGRQIIEARFCLAGEGLTQYLAMLGFNRTSVARRPALQAQNEIVVEIANAEAA